jgi:hypothetical protein
MQIVKSVVSDFITIYIVYNDPSLEKDMEFYTEWLSVCPNITSKSPTIAIFKTTVVAQNNLSNKTCRCVHDLYCSILQLL